MERFLISFIRREASSMCKRSLSSWGQPDAWAMITAAGFCTKSSGFDIRSRCNMPAK